MNEVATVLLQQDLNGDNQIDAKDLSSFTPREHRQHTYYDYASMLPDAGPFNVTLVEMIYANRPDSEKANWVMAEFGETPWVTPTNAAPTVNTGDDQNAMSPACPRLALQRFLIKPLMIMVVLFQPRLRN